MKYEFVYKNVNAKKKLVANSVLLHINVVFIQFNILKGNIKLSSFFSYNL